MPSGLSSYGKIPDLEKRRSELREIRNELERLKAEHSSLVEAEGMNRRLARSGKRLRKKFKLLEKLEAKLNLT